MLSNDALSIITRLNNAGFEAYAVGGCVRDMLLQKPFDDIDIATNASPSSVQHVFRDRKVIPTGLQHGTVTVLWQDSPIEITTYRTDGDYSDGRHPDTVRFTSSLTEDLARRDFTINAIAYHPTEGLIDPFGGINDLELRLLRCVGDAQTRFQEDALRIVRLVRFASTLGFRIEESTAAAAKAQYPRLELVAAERKRVELIKMLCGDSFETVAADFHDILCHLVPPLTACVGLKQDNPHHDADVYTHTIRAVQHSTRDPIVRLALLLHDIGKPACFTHDEHGVGHFYGHPAVSAALAEATLKDLRFDHDTVKRVVMLVNYHDIPVSADRKIVKRRLARFGTDGFEQLLQVKEADAAACIKGCQPPDFSGVRQTVNRILEKEECIDRHRLHLNGHDLMQCGYEHGPKLGHILQEVFDAVLDERVENSRDALLAYVKERWPL